MHEADEDPNEPGHLLRQELGTMPVNELRRITDAPVRLDRIEGAINRLTEVSSKFHGDTERALCAQGEIARGLTEQHRLQQARIDNSQADLTLLKELVEDVHVEIKGLRADLAQEYLRTAAKFANQNGHAPKRPVARKK